MEAQPPEIEQHKTETKGLHTRRAFEAEAAIHSLWARGGSGSLTTYSSHFIENPLACS